MSAYHELSLSAPMNAQLLPIGIINKAYVDLTLI
jgi:hypothetical protein